LVLETAGLVDFRSVNELILRGGRMDHDTHVNGRTTPTVVVGVDDSAGAAEALRWAIAEARLRGAPLRAIHAYPYWAAQIGYYGELGLGIAEMRSAAGGVLERAIDGLGAEAEGVDIHRRVIPGQAADVLIAAAGAEDLLVVGSRGHGGLAGLLLGSVSQRCVQHARCPVVVVHPPSRVLAGRVVRHAEAL
jgi:nucleotide-binding universal stress UspA family protein